MARLSERRPRNRRNRNRRKKRKNVFLRIALLVAILIGIIFSIYKGYIFIKEKFIIPGKKRESSEQYYSYESLDRIYSQYNSSLQYKKFSIKDGALVRNNNQYEIYNVIKNNYQDYLLGELNKYFVENKIDTKKLSISIKNKNGNILSINEAIKYKDINIEKIVKLILIRSAMVDKILTEDMEFSILAADLINGSSLYTKDNIGEKVSFDHIFKYAYLKNEPSSIAMLNRIILEKGLSSKYNLDVKTDGYSMNEVAETFKRIEGSSSILASYFEELLKENRDLFLSSIYSEEGNKNIINKNGNNIFEAGIVKKASSYIYAIHTEGIEVEKIKEIASIIDRNIEKIESMRKIYK